MDPVAPEALALATLLKGELSKPDNAGYWRQLESLKVPGIEFIGNWSTHDLKIGERVVVLEHSAKTANPALIIGTIDRDPAEKNFCVSVKTEAIVTPKDELPESVGLDLNRSYLVGGFQVFRAAAPKRLD